MNDDGTNSPSVSDAFPVIDGRLTDSSPTDRRGEGLADFTVFDARTPNSHPDIELESDGFSEADFGRADLGVADSGRLNAAPACIIASPPEGARLVNPRFIGRGTVSWAPDSNVAVVELTMGLADGFVLESGWVAALPDNGDFRIEIETALRGPVVLTALVTDLFGVQGHCEQQFEVAR